MDESPSKSERPDYGIDAPGVVRNLFLVGGLGFLVWGTAALGWWSGVLSIPLPGGGLNLSLTGMGFGCGVGFTSMGIWMLWSSKVGKVRSRERLFQRIMWTGKERVLDVGCGRGLMLIGAAKRLTTGSATGIDLWQAEDLSGNRPEATLENARREGVADRIEVKTADMRRIPFADQTFDVVVSCAAIHNLYKAGERAEAISEIARVLKPGGQALIDDIRHIQEYASVFSQNGCAEVRQVGSRVVSVLLMLITFGSLRPGTLLVRR
ncbi:MAG TPA: class I SAM-dependent methyltransferase [Pyrinomonadaceae bacterium]|jgi:SAM-dependent methyltransferase|nr:class I SAM-dependent methyltransferase [Pyrinomonadaceae bacterium]